MGESYFFSSFFSSFFLLFFFLFFVGGEMERSMD